MRVQKLHNEEFCDIYALSNIIWVFFMLFIPCIFLQLAMIRVAQNKGVQAKHANLGTVLPLLE